VVARSRNHRQAFALSLYLRDVYWCEEGRSSIA